MSARRAAASKPSRFAATQQPKKPAARAAAAKKKTKSPPARATPKVSAKKKVAATSKKITPKRATKLVPKTASKKAAARKVPVAAPVTTKVAARKSAPPKRAAKPAKVAIKATTPSVGNGKDKSMVETAKPAARAVVRIARGLRTPKQSATLEAQKEAAHNRGRGRDGIPIAPTRRSGAKIEINPKLERSKHLVTSTGPAEGTAPKTMSVAAKHRAAAEAVFAKLTVPETKPEVEAAPPTARAPDPAAGSYAMRINEHDSAVTALRLASSREETLAAARNLADRFKLPPDQSLLLQVVSLGDEALTKLALEELLELEDRGRVRPSAELKSVLSGVESSDSETREIKQLLLEKIGVVY